MVVDTNALSAWAEGNPGIEAPLASARQLVIPSIVLGEYYFGIRKSKHRKRYEAWMRDYLVFVKVGLINHQTAKTYADIRLELKKQGTPIPSNDTWIAAVARQHGLPVLSNDTHFDRVKKLKRIGF